MSLQSRFAAAVLVAVALATVLLSCGEDSPGSREGAEMQIEELTGRFSRALATEDAKAFCALLAPNDRQRLGGGETDGARECLVVWGTDRNPLFSAKGTDLEVEGLAFEGAYATAELANGGTLGFAREGGRWYVHLAPSSNQLSGIGS